MREVLAEKMKPIDGAALRRANDRSELVFLEVYAILWDTGILGDPATCPE